MRRLAGITVWLLAIVMAWAAGGRCQAAERPNIVLILADDVSPEMFGCYGSPDAKTPNLDRMAAEGVMFRTAWASALCSPARAEIMTGRYASRTGSWSNGLATSQADGAGLFATHHSFAKLLQTAGYATAVAGKWHIHAAEHPGEPVVGFDEYCLWESQADLDRLPGRPRHQGAWEDETTPSRYWHPCIVRNHEPVPTKPHDFGPTMFTDFLCDFMRRSAAAGKPFLAYYPMVAPHGTRDGHTTCPIYGEPGDMGGPREDRARRFRALVDHLDLLVGRLEQEARDLGVIDRTVFIFCSDNGTAVTAKSRGVERGCHVPMIVWGAGVKKRGSTDEICDLSDILPTLVDYAGATLPSGYEVDGRSLVPFLRGESDAHRDWILSCIGGTRLVRSRTHLLEVVCPILGVPEGRFYACGASRDGRGYRRAEGDPAHAEVRRQFDAILERHPGLSADDPVFSTPPAARWLRDYQAPAEREKHLHNHKNYQVYDETLAAEPPATKPNVIFILTDDQGWGDARFAGHPYVKTPNLDRLSSEGTWFRQFYVAATVCSPSRAAFMTSHYPARHRIHGHFSDHPLNAARSMPNWLDPTVITLADLLKSAGYATAHFGKWHLGAGPGAPPPEDYGFDVSKTVGSTGPSLGNENAEPFFRATSTRLIVDETIRFIRQHRESPFYVNVWTLLPHALLRPTQEQLAVYADLQPKAGAPAFGPWMQTYLGKAEDLRSQMQVFCASLTDLDTQIGRLLDALDEMQLSGNTIVVFSSDNGPEDYRVRNAANAGVGSTGMLRGRKRSMYEGGIRTFGVVRWPGKVPAGRVDETNVVGAVDVLPTVAALAGVMLPERLEPDGEDLSPLWLGQDHSSRAKPLHWEWLFNVQGSAEGYRPPMVAIREGDWKLFVNHDGNGAQLYDIREDAGETHDLAAHHPAEVKGLTEKALAWVKTLPPSLARDKAAATGRPVDPRPEAGSRPGRRRGARP